MSLFSWFKKCSPEESIELAMQELFPKIFPGGHSEILRAGENISAILGGKLSPHESSRIYSSTKYLMYTSKDHSQEELTSYILSRGSKLISLHEAVQIYNFLITGKLMPENKEGTKDDIIFINEDLENQNYKLTNDNRTVVIKASLFTLLFLFAKQAGWSGGQSMFLPDGNTLKAMTGMYTINNHDATSLATTLQLELKKKGVDSQKDDNVRTMMSFINFFAEGGFEIQA